jgi:tRNA pseudouridine55 synthase
MDGLLIIDKPAGITSHDVVAKVRRILKTKRVGHTGTLDPFATGVMVILVGKATRLAQFLDKDEKQYEAVIRFGFETDTGDVTGIPKSERQGSASISAVEVENVLPKFLGETEQIPPMYSAKKIDGKKLYEHARKGEVVDRKAVKITIPQLEVVGQPSADEVAIRVSCSAGTYIRTLAEDIGREIGTGAHLTALRRTRAGSFAIEKSVTLDQLAEADEAAAFLLPASDAVEHLAPIILSEERVEKTRNGLSTRLMDADHEDGQFIKLVSAEGELVAIGKFSATDSSVKPTVVL